MAPFPKMLTRTVAAGFALLSLSFPAARGALGQSRDTEKHRLEGFAQFGGAFYTPITREFDIPTVPPTRAREDVSFAKTGRVIAGLRWSLRDRDQLEAAYSFSPGWIHSVITDPMTPPSANASVLGVHIFHLSFSYVRAFETTGRVQPFLSAGAGFVIFEGGLEVETKPAGNLGIGMDVRLTDRWAFRLEQRTVISGAPRGISTAREGALFHFVPSAGFVFRF